MERNPLRGASEEGMERNPLRGGGHGGDQDGAEGDHSEGWRGKGSQWRGPRGIPSEGGGWKINNFLRVGGAAMNMAFESGPAVTVAGYKGMTTH